MHGPARKLVCLVCQLRSAGGAGNDGVQVGIATFDTSVHFYSLAASQSQAQMLVMPDIDDVYTVGASSLIVPLQPSLQLVRILQLHSFWAPVSRPSAYVRFVFVLCSCRSHWHAPAVLLLLLIRYCMEAFMMPVLLMCVC